MKNGVTRRTLIQNASFAAGAALLGLEAQAIRNEKPRVLALIGDRYHNPDYIRVSLNKVFGELGIPVDYTINYDQLSADLLHSYQLLVMFRDGMIWPAGYLGPDAYGYEANLETPKTFPEPQPINWMTEEQGAAVRDFVLAGGGLYALHNSSHISLSSKHYREAMGAAYIGHPALRPFQVRATSNKHPITDGVAPFVVNDEQHYITYDKDPKYVILEAENLDGLSFETLGTKSISGYAYDYGRGRVVFTAVGHTIHAMWNPQYIEIQKRSIKWLLKDL